MCLQMVIMVAVPEDDATMQVLQLRDPDVHQERDHKEHLKYFIVVLIYDISFKSFSTHSAKYALHDYYGFFNKSIFL